MLELLHVIPRWPNVAAALALHALALGVMLLAPQPMPEPLDPDPPGPMPPFVRPAWANPTQHSIERGTSGPRPHGTKTFPKPDAPTPAPTPEPVAILTSLEGDSPPELPDSGILDSQSGSEADGGSDGSDPAGGTGDGGGSLGQGDGLGGQGQGGPSASEPIRMTSQVTAPRIIHRVEPAYPGLARTRGMQGDVILECVIDQFGAVEVRRILRSSPLLDTAAVAAVEQWRYEPARRDGHPQAVILSVTVSFSLAR